MVAVNDRTAISARAWLLKLAGSRRQHLLAPIPDVSGAPTEDVAEYESADESSDDPSKNLGQER